MLPAERPHSCSRARVTECSGVCLCLCLCLQCALCCTCMCAVCCASLEAMFIRAALSALSSRSTLSSSTRQDVNSSAQAVERREFSRSLCCGVQLPIVLRARACLNRFRALLECRSLAAALVLCLQRQLRLSERTHNSNQNSTWSTHSLTRVVRRS